MEKQYPISEDLLLSLFSSRNLGLLCDSRGRILKHGIPQFQYQATHPFNEIIKTGNVCGHFDFSPHQDLDALPEETSMLPGRPGFLVFEDFGLFYTSLPLLDLKIRKVRRGLFLCEVLVSEIVPNFYSGPSGSFFLVDEEEKLVGFNHSFFNHFASSVRGPRDLMNQPLRKFLSPTPRKIQDDFLADLVPEKAREFKSLATADFRGQSTAPPGFSFFGGDSAAFGKEGCSWKNPSNDISLFRHDSAIDVKQHDFMAVLEVEVQCGHSPFLDFTYDRPSRVLATETFYQLGRHGLRDLSVIKKDGFVLHAADYPGEKDTGNIVHHFCKIGETWLWFQNGKRMLGYFDNDPPANTRGYLALALRGGGECLLKRLDIKVKPCSGLSVDDLLKSSVVRLQAAGREHFLLSRYLNFSLSSRFFKTQGYFIQNISQIQKKMDLLANQVQGEIRRSRQLESLLNEFRRGQDSFVGSGPKSAQLREKARIVAHSNATILIQGGTGTGKEVLANFIHSLSPFRDGPFIKVDCSTLPKELMESELFGHEKGAFTGALNQKPGKFEQAEGGTLFLDEVGNLDLSIQAKLLQFLQDIAITRVGGTKPIPLKLRVIAATNIPLENLIRAGAFRQDLYYRLFVVVIDVPSLSERKEDLPELCAHFVKFFSESSGRKIRGISPSAYKVLSDYDWPGNIRELRNVIQRAVLFCREDEITEDLITFTPLEARPPVLPEKRSQGQVLSKMPDKELASFLEKHKGRMVATAKDLGVSRRALYYHLKRRGLDADRYRTVSPA